jgi:DNA-binding PadR family transcriptional regulator
MSPEVPALGEFEQMVLLAVLQAGKADEGAYGITVFDELTSRAKRRVARGAVYMTLDRLEKKGLLKSWTTAPTAERGGRAKRCYEVTPPAMAALRESHAALQRLWTGLNLVTERRGRP